MKNKFLYIKQINKLGILDDTESFEDSMYFMSSEYDDFYSHLNESSIDSFLEYFITLFKEDIPNSNRLLAGFSSDIIEGKNNLIVTDNFNRKDVNLIRIELKDKVNLNAIKTISIEFENDIKNNLDKVLKKNALNNSKIIKINYNPSLKNMQLVL